MFNKNNKIGTYNHYLVFFIGLFLPIIIFAGFISQQDKNNKIFDYPIDATVSGYNNKIYVLNNSGFVTEVNLENNKMTDKMYVGVNPYNIKINPNINKLYISNSGDDTVTIIDLSKKTTKTISVGTNPNKIYINTVNNKVYILNSDGISVLNGLDDYLMSTISLSDKPVSMDILKSLNIVYITTYNSNTVTVINGEKDEIVFTPSFYFKPRMLFVAQTGSGLYIFDKLNNSIVVADVLTGKIIDRHSTLGNIHSAILTTDERVLYVANDMEDFDNIEKINVEKKARQTIDIKGKIFNIIEIKENIYAFNSVYPEVSIIDKLNFEQKEIISLPEVYDRVFFNKKLGKLYLLSKSNEIGIFDVDTNKFIGTIPNESRAR